MDKLNAQYAECVKKVESVEQQLQKRRRISMLWKGNAKHANTNEYQQKADSCEFVIGSI